MATDESSVEDTDADFRHGNSHGAFSGRDTSFVVRDGQRDGVIVGFAVGMGRGMGSNCDKCWFIVEILGV